MPSPYKKKQKELIRIKFLRQQATKQCRQHTLFGDNARIIILQFVLSIFETLIYLSIFACHFICLYKLIRFKFSTHASSAAFGTFSIHIVTNESIQVHKRQILRQCPCQNIEIEMPTFLFLITI